MNKKKPIQSHLQIIVRDKKGKFTKHDGRKKQLIQIRDRKSNEVYSLEKNINKKLFKKLKSEVENVIKHKTFRSIKIIKKEYERSKKKVDFVVSKPYELKKELQTKRIETIYISETFNQFIDMFYSIFEKAIETKSFSVVIIINLLVNFSKRREGLFYIYSQTIKSDIKQETIKRLINEIAVLISDKKNIFTKSSKPIKFRIQTKIVWKYEK